MTVPVVSSTSPANSAIDINITSAVTVTFNTNILATSVIPGTFMMYRTDTYDAVAGDISVSNNVIRLTPAKALYEDTQYRVAVVGSADSNPAGSIESSDGDNLVNTYTFSFRTAVQSYATFEEVAERADVTYDGPIRTEDITDPGGLEISSVYPRGFATDRDVDLDRVVFTFSNTIDATTVIPGETVFMETNPVLGIDDYYGAPGNDGLTYLYGCSPTGAPLSAFTQPTGTFTATGTTIIWTRAPGEPDFNYNTEILFTISQEVQDTNGHTLEADVNIVMTTEYFPKFMSSRIMRVEAGPMLSDQFDDTLNRMLHKNSLEAYEEAGYGFNIRRPYPAVRRWVKAKSMIDMFNMISSRAQALAGQMKELGDLRIQYTMPRPEVGVPIKQRAERELIGLTQELRAYRRQNIPLVAIKGEFAGDLNEARRARTWDIEYESGGTFYNMTSLMIPASNMRSMRATKMEVAHDAHPHIDHTSSTYYYGTTSRGAGLFICPGTAT